MKNKYSAKEFEYKEEDYYIKQINDLHKYSPEPKFDWAIMGEDLDGEFVLLEDVLKLFSAQKE